jgi:Zn-dependent protease with chaperone function
MTDGVPARARARFPGISSRAYEHPADRSALVALRKLQGFDAILRRMTGLFQERSLRLMYLASAVRTGDTQFRDLHHIVLDAADVLDLAEVPELFVVNNPMPQAMTLGVDKPFIVLTTGLVDLMDDEELRFTVGHELGHVLSGHVVYRTLLFHLVGLATRASWVPLGSLGLRAIITSLEEWFRKSELSCDRAGLLVGQDVKAGLRCLMKAAGGSHLHEMNTDAFLAQAAEYNVAGDLRDGVIKILSLQGRTHPFVAVRAAELKRWAEGIEYHMILDGDYPRRQDDTQTSLFDEMKTTAASYRESITQSTDPLVTVLRDLAGDAAGAGERLFTRLTRRD